MISLLQIHALVVSCLTTCSSFPPISLNISRRALYDISVPGQNGPGALYSLGNSEACKTNDPWCVGKPANQTIANQTTANETTANHMIANQETSGGTAVVGANEGHWTVRAVPITNHNGAHNTVTVHSFLQAHINSRLHSDQLQ